MSNRRLSFREKFKRKGRMYGIKRLDYWYTNKRYIGWKVHFVMPNTLNKYTEVQITLLDKVYGGKEMCLLKTLAVRDRFIDHLIEWEDKNGTNRAIPASLIDSAKEDAKYLMGFLKNTEV